MRVAAVLTNRDFNLYWAGVVFSQIGTRGTVAANLYHVYQLTGSVTQTGLVGAGQAVALLVLEPARRRVRRPLGPAQAAAVVAGGRDGGGRRARGADADRSYRGLAGAGVGRVDHGGSDFRPAGQAGADSGAGAPRAAAAGVRVAQPVAGDRGAAGPRTGRRLHRHRGPGPDVCGRRGDLCGAGGHPAGAAGRETRGRRDRIPRCGASSSRARDSSRAARSSGC